MAEASTRVLLDRTTVRLDGRSFFAFGPRIYLTPRERIASAVADCADAGFTAVMTPPASPGNLPALNAVFDECERRGLLTILSVEPRLPDPSAFLSANFKHRSSLHSYCLETPDDSEASFIRYCAERDRLRAEDLFHPIWTPWKPGFPYRLWIASVDLHSVSHGTGGPLPRTKDEDGAGMLNEIFRTCSRERLQGRPFFCSSFATACTDRTRAKGVFAFDPLVAATPAESRDWYPWMAAYGEMPRHDLTIPDPDLVRLRTYELLAARTRGIVADFYEAMLGPSPMTGRDRFCELAVLAQEIGVFAEFFAEGQFVRADVETGHPLLKAAMLHHGEDILLLLWRSAEGDEFWIDPARMTRLEVFIGLQAQGEVNAWRMDFPGEHPIPLVRDAKGDVRLQLDSIDLTAKILLTRSRQRPMDLAARLQERLPKATRFRVDCVRYRCEKVRYVERVLEEMHRGSRDGAPLREARDLVREADRLIEEADWRAAWIAAAQAAQLLRTLVNQQMVRATAAGRATEEGSVLDALRKNYMLLPEYYRRAQERTEAVVEEYT